MESRINNLIDLMCQTSSNLTILVQDFIKQKSELRLKLNTMMALIYILISYTICIMIYY